MPCVRHRGDAIYLRKHEIIFRIRWSEGVQVFHPYNTNGANPITYRE